MTRRVCACSVLAILVPLTAAAQETRADALERQRAEKAANLQPYEPGKLEKIFIGVEAENPMAKIAPHNGFFAEYGYSHKPTGSGIGIGGGYRHDLFGRTARVELEAGISFKNYQMLRADFSLPYLADDRVEVGVEASYHHHPQEDFYGLGPAALHDDRVSYLYDARDYQARAIARPWTWLETGVRFGLVNPSLGRGTDDGYPSIEELYTDPVAPGLAFQPDFIYNEVFAAIDYRDQRGNARDGGFYRIAWRGYDDRDADRFGFGRIDATVQQFFPIFDKKRVFAAQWRLMTASPGDGQLVPFYFKPTLGGGNSVRSLADFRFRDDHVMFLNFEYRWEAFTVLDMALFTDWGKVAADRGDLDFSDMKRAYGIGFRVATAKAVLMRFDIATGAGEGVKYIFKFSRVF